jgi:hypothetical protein
MAGTVDVFTGEHLVAGQATIAEVPTATGTYMFNLPPGRYVLVGHSPATNLYPPTVTVTVTSGTITQQDLDYQGCM